MEALFEQEYSPEIIFAQLLNLQFSQLRIKGGEGGSNGKQMLGRGRNVNYQIMINDVL